MSVKILFFFARRHYELQLMRRVYQEWHEMWWELRKEWRLMVRAECHHRYETNGQRLFVYLSLKAVLFMSNKWCEVIHLQISFKAKYVSRFLLDNEIIYQG